MRIGGGLCGGAGASPLRLQPLGFKGERAGDATFMGLRRVNDHAVGSGDPSNAAETYEMAEVAGRLEPTQLRPPYMCGCLSPA